MNKYLEIAKIGFKEQTAYNFNNAFKIILSIARIVLAFLLWSVLFKGKENISGFSFGMMMTYYIAINFLRGLDSSDSMVLSLSSEIREGKFTRYLVRPVKPLLFFISICYSRSAYYFIINVFTSTAFILIFRDYFHITYNLVSFLWMIVIVMAGMNFLILLNYFVAIMSFKFMEVSAFNILKGSLIEFLTGAIIPIALLPEFARNIMVYFPFYHIYYLPALLLIGKDDFNPLYSLSILALWNIIMLVIIKITYKKLVKKYEGVGI
jgi:ABC-2 type transport system permease protein